MDEIQKFIQISNFLSPIFYLGVFFTILGGYLEHFGNVLTKNSHNSNQESLIEERKPYW
jgi:hypothetical protein